jgi:hypothetical protein
MKRLVFVLLIAAGLLASCSDRQGWFRLNSNEVHVADFTLPPGQSRTIVIDSAQPATIGFKTELAFSRDNAELYQELTAKYKSNVIRFKDGNKGGMVSSAFGGSIRCEPAGGRITVEAGNMTDRDFKVVIYRMKWAPAAAGKQ